MSRGYIYFILIIVLLCYLIHLYIPIIKKSKRQDKIEKSIISITDY